jgi:hypothetical protein
LIERNRVLYEALTIVRGDVCDSKFFQSEKRKNRMQ